MSILLVAFLLLAAVAQAALVQLKTGYSLEVEAYRIEEDKFIMEVNGGTVTVPLDLVETIDDAELVTSLPGAPETVRPPTGLDFKASARVPETPYGELIYGIARRLRFNSTLLAAIVEVESGFDKDKVSANGRLGLLQVNPKHSFGIDRERLLDPEANLEAGVRHLNWLRKRYENDLDQVLVGYHFGRSSVEGAGGVSQAPEVLDYLAQIEQALQRR